MIEACFIELCGVLRLKMSIIHPDIHREVDSPTLSQTAGSSDLSAIDCTACPLGRSENDHPTSASDCAVVPLNPLALKD